MQRIAQARHIWVLLAGILVALMVVEAAGDATSPTPMRNIAQGRLAESAEQGVSVFRDIPYVSPLVGERR